MTPAKHDEMLACRERLLRALTVEMERRQENGDDWIEKERLAVQQAAYEWSQRKRLPIRPTCRDIENLEVYAIGHVDYAPKLCLYVAEYLYGERGRP